MALKRIALRDFVIVPSLELDLQSGFTVLTGETGAGKSILIDALQLALGARADTGSIREGAPRTDVCAEFECPPHTHCWLEEAGFDIDDTLLLRRTVDAQGKSRGWINGIPATAAQLRQLGELLLDIHGQHAWQGLTRSETVRELLDAYAGVDTSRVTACWTRWRSDQQSLQLARDAQSTLTQERERLQWQIGELEKLAPGADEWAELDTQHHRLAHAQTLIEAAQVAMAALTEESEGHSGLQKAYSVLRDQSHIEPAFEEMTQVLATCLSLSDDVRHSLQAYLRRADVDPQQLADVEARMALWLSLARRYRRQPSELHALLESWKSELRQLDASADLDTLEAAEARTSKEYLAAARQLTAARQKAAPALSRTITEAMQELGMDGGAFEVRVEPAKEPSSHGQDEITFLVAGHAGTTPRPIGKVASGGELSRLALAIAVTTSAGGSAPTLIFDEVDSGIGGAVAETVGRLMQRLGSTRQVLAVTHLAQVAACADHHLTVSKQQTRTGTSSSVEPVTADRRVEEIARMLGGERTTAAATAHARELLGLHTDAVRGTG